MILRPSAFALLLGPVLAAVCPAAEPPRPNIVFIMADDLGYGELGCFGQEKIETPVLDRLAAEGMKLTSFYAGATVCAPSRCVLMTGMHGGHAWVRGNGGPEIQTLRDGDVTVSEALRAAGYATSLCGKWGLGELGSAGHPNRQGFDHFFGYLNQHHAHNYYPPFLVRDGERVKLGNDFHPEWAPKDGGRHPGGGFSANKAEYSHDLIMADALVWLDAHHGGPFFLYLALTIPHANNEAGRVLGDGQEVPDYGPYADKDWPDPDKGQAAMITRMDRDVGRLVARLEALGVAQNTLVFFTSDNGHHKEGGNDPGRFDANGPLRGMKRDLYEGGIRVPTVAWWPGTIGAGTSSDHPATAADIFATLCDLAGADAPDDNPHFTSVSIAPTLLGNPESQKPSRSLYWEFYERGSTQAVRFDEWKAVRKPMFTGPTELYHLGKDIGEHDDVAGQNPEVVAKAEGLMEAAHVPNPNWGK